MFFEEGWAALADVTQTVIGRVQAFHVANAADGTPMPTEAEMMEEVAVSIWEICDAATKAGVTSSEGNLIPASRGLLLWDDPRKMFNRHVDLRLGNVGSAPATESTPEAMQARYGPFLHLPIAIPQNGVQSSLTFLEEELRDKPERDPNVQQAAAKIVQTAAAGQPMTREYARKQIAPGLTRRKFKVTWALACDHRPELRRTLGEDA